MSSSYTHISLLPTNFVPSGWKACDGSTLKVADHQKLFEAIGNHFGGDGKQEFKLPDLSDKSPAQNLHYCIWEEPEQSPTFGEIRLFLAGTEAPNWIKCDGELLPISQHSGLYSLIGNIFGGDGRTTFGLPDLRDKAPSADTLYMIAIAGNYPSRH